ncbi:hypothetical protein Tco_0585525 [Tanacetum coccineum]
MANENVPAPAPTRSDDQILLFDAWVPIGKSNFVLDLQKKQKNPIFQIFVDILQNTNFFKAFTASASVPATYIQHTNVDYAELTWEECIQAIKTFLTDKANLGSPTKKCRNDKPNVIPYCQFTKLIIYHLGRKHNLHLNDFEDLYLLHLQGQLNHLSGAHKVHLFNAVNLWIRNIVIRKCMEDLQLGIESYQTKLNLTQPDWDASDFLFKEDYTIVSKPRAVIYRDRNDQKKMMQETEVHKFSDGTLHRILDQLDHMVKDFKLFKYNLGMETRI